MSENKTEKGTEPMSENTTPEKKIRIMQRDDGAVFAHTTVLESIPNMRPGWKIFKEDGSQEIVLDKVTAQQINPNTVHAREKALIEENAKLREQLAQAQGIVNSPVTAPSTDLEPGETPLPDSSKIANLTNAAPVEEEPIDLQPEPEMIPKSRLERMGVERLTSYAKELNFEVVIPADAEKSELVELCLAQQEIYKAKVSE